MPKEAKTKRATKPKADKKKKVCCRRCVDNFTEFSLTSFKDPNAPKRGLSAYMFFAQDQRDNVREENPGISFGKLRTLPAS